MRSFKNHIGVIFPLVILLFGVEFSLMVNKIVQNYESAMGNDYNIIIVSQNELNATVLKDEINKAKEEQGINKTLFFFYVLNKKERLYD